MAKALAKLKNLTTINHNPEAHRELAETLADLFGGSGYQEAADKWMLVVALIAGGTHPPDDRLDARVEDAFAASSRAMDAMKLASVRERTDRNKAKDPKPKPQPITAAANGSEGQAPSPN